MGRRWSWLLAVVLGCVLAPSALAHSRGSADVAALQVALRAGGHYGGSIDGLPGPATAAAVRRFQARAGLVVDGIAGARTRRTLGRRGRPPLGRRVIRPGASGWDVAGLQFLLAWQGFPSGPIDGGFGARTQAALIRFQRRAGLGADGLAGAATVAALRSAPPRSPLAMLRPVRFQPLGDRFGPRGARFHTGLDFRAPTGWNVRAARSGRVRSSGFLAGFGRTVVIAHGLSVRTLYAHLSAALVRPGQWVVAGQRIGLVGSTGFATGPHLHFEVLVGGASVDPLPALG